MKRLLHPSQWNYSTYEAMQTLRDWVILIIALTAFFYGCSWWEPSDDYHHKDPAEYDSYGEYMIENGYADDVCYWQGGEAVC